MRATKAVHVNLEEEDMDALKNGESLGVWFKEETELVIHPPE